MGGTTVTDFQSGNRKGNKERMDQVFPKDFCRTSILLAMYWCYWRFEMGREGDKWAILGQAHMFAPRYHILTFDTFA